jgi:hypothetical protein
LSTAAFFFTSCWAVTGEHTFLKAISSLSAALVKHVKNACLLRDFCPARCFPVGSYSNPNIENILHYLDGAYVSIDLANVPATWSTVARSGLNNQIGLLDCGTQNGFLTRIKAQLVGIMSASGATSEQHQLAGQLIQYVDTLNQWLGGLKADTVKLVGLDRLS